MRRPEAGRVHGLDPTLVGPPVVGETHGVAELVTDGVVDLLDRVRCETRAEPDAPGDDDPVVDGGPPAPQPRATAGRARRDHHVDLTPTGERAPRVQARRHRQRRPAGGGRGLRRLLDDSPVGLDAARGHEPDLVAVDVGRVVVGGEAVVDRRAAAGGRLPLGLVHDVVAVVEHEVETGERVDLGADRRGRPITEIGGIGPDQAGDRDERDHDRDDRPTTATRALAPVHGGCSLARPQGHRAIPPRDRQRPRA